MTEYWKSNARKFCDYCKCWYADNRASIDFHESGKKHKENVAKRLQEIGKRGREDYDNSLKVDDYMKQMEQAALKAYKEDLGANPDITGTEFVELAKERNADIVIRGEEPKKKANLPTGGDPSKWHEAKSKDGHSYFYHIESKETRWEKPPEGFISIDEQKSIKKKRKKSDKNQKESKKEAKTELPVSNAATDRFETQPTQDTTTPSVVTQAEPVTKTVTSGDSYGSWSTVQKPVLPDLQLPKVPGWDEDDEEAYSAYPREPPHQFTQKTVTLAGTSANTSFKRKKNADGNKKNARTRNNDL